jgi:sterol desaturase/sphingolipid hydroxylase (fatty acid hydroxylase superfamily)
MDSIDRILLFVALPVVVAAAFIEALVLSYRQSGERYDWRAAGVSLLDLVVRISLQIFVPISLALPFIYLASKYKLTSIAVDGWVALLALFIGQEFCYYWYHRAAHRVRWFWANHAVHHSPNQLNLSAAYRIGVLSKLGGSAIFFVPLVWLGFPPKLVFQLFSLNLLYQFWIHATWIPKLGWLEYVLNTPSAHRVHHAANLEYLDANYGGVLIVFDRLFGTYKAEREDLPCRYGWVKPITSHNPLRIEFTQWAHLLRDVFTANSIRAALGFLVRPPGWRPDGNGETTEELRARAKVATNDTSIGRVAIGAD